MNLDHSQVEDLKRIVKSAGDILMKYYRQDITVSTKTDFTPVTLADTLSNDFIVEHLSKKFPTFGIVSEEGPRNWKDFTFTVDPLAGTKNFIAGQDRFDVMISLLDKGSPIYGIIYNPVRNTFWYGGKDKGCYFENLDGVKEIKILEELKSNKNILITRRKFKEDYNIKNKFYMEDGPFTRSDLYIADQSGNVRILPEGVYFIWDYAPSQAILEGAGGVVINKDGSDFSYKTGSDTFTGNIISLDNIERFKSLLI